MLKTRGDGSVGCEKGFCKRTELSYSTSHESTRCRIYLSQRKAGIGGFLSRRMNDDVDGKLTITTDNLR